MNQRSLTNKVTANWTPSLREVLIDSLLEEKRLGTIGIDNSIKKPVWTKLESEFHRRTGVNYDKQQLQTGLNNMKAKYTVFIQILLYSSVFSESLMAYPHPFSKWLLSFRNVFGCIMLLLKAAQCTIRGAPPMHCPNAAQKSSA
jgi:hypothetical protein